MIHAHMNNYVHFNQHFSSSSLRTYSFRAENKPFVFLDWKVDWSAECELLSESPVFPLSLSYHWGAAKGVVSCIFFFFFKDKCVILDQNRDLYYDTSVGKYRADFPYHNVHAFYVSKFQIISEECVRHWRLCFVYDASCHWLCSF